MAFDPHPNLALSIITTAPNPPTTGTTLTVSAGQGGWFQAAPFNATVWPANVVPTPLNAEIVRVTARTTDTLTIVRAQEGTTARAIAAGDQIAASITRKTLTDVETEFATVVRTNVANTFTANQTISAASPALNFNDTAQPANSRILYWRNTAQQMQLVAVDDAYGLQGVPLSATRTGDVVVGNNLSVTGLGGNVACKNQGNTFTTNQNLSAANPLLTWNDTSAPANSRLMYWVNTAQQMVLRAVDDGYGIQTAPITATRTGDVTIWRDLYEKQRATPLGHWQTLTPTLGSNIGSAVINTTLVCQYTLIGKTIILLFFMQITVSGSPTVVTLNLPAGVTTAAYSAVPFTRGTAVGMARCDPSGGTKVNLLVDVAGSLPWASETLYIAGTVTAGIL